VLGLRVSGYSGMGVTLHTAAVARVRGAVGRVDVPIILVSTSGILLLAYLAGPPVRCVYTTPATARHDC
jgi:hypothetical protein